MKKSYSYIFLSMLLAFSMYAGNLFSVSTSAIDVGISSPVSTSFSSNFNSPDSEIEHFNNSGNHISPSSQGIQKATGHLNFYEKPIVSIPAIAYPGSFEQVELFDNNYLYYNYPSHNFW